MTSAEIIDTLSVCFDCLLLAANGEISPDHPADQPLPLSLIEPGYSVTAGGEHNGCEGCDGECDNLGFSWHWCEGCGSTLGGDRHAMTLWKD